MNKKIEELKILELLEYTNSYKIPIFPISGDYLKARGYKTGKEIGKKLKLLEEKWIDNNFLLDGKILEKSLGKINQN